ncbi:MAG TPA: hypothetical protein VM243_07430 [Phycisphaerae bacterium]|nr:hypothetical protein [Phycisphaerae bacterium]
MKRSTTGMAAVAGVVLAFGGLAHADVAVVIEHQYTIGNNNFSAFAYNPLVTPNEFMTTGYGFGKDLRWSQVLDDSVEPWDMDGGILMDSPQIEFFARDGFASFSLSYNAWGMNFNPLDQKYFIGCISILRDPANNNERVDAERDLIWFDPHLPNGGAVQPSGVSVSNTGGVYSLVDSALGAGTGFVSSGVEVGHQLTLYPLHYTAEINATTYTVTEIVSETELRLDKDPLWPGSPTQVDKVSYILTMQPWLTLKTFRQNLPYFADDPDAGPKAHYKGGLSLDGTTLYIGETISDNMIAVDTQARETFSVFITKSTYEAYVQAQSDAGRLHPIINPDRAYVDDTTGLEVGWSNQSTSTSVSYGITDPPAPVGKRCMSATFNAAAAQLKFHAYYGPEDTPRSASDYTHLAFWIHGGTAGGQQMDVSLYDADGVPGSAVTVAPPTAGAWTLVEIPIGDFGVSTIGDIVYDNTVAASQPIFYLDDVGFLWTDPLPVGVGDYISTNGGVPGNQTDCDAEGRIWFSEEETNDILWTTNGVDLNTFLTSEEIVSAYIASGTLDPSPYFISNGVQVMGLIVDPMGTVYWGENQTRSIWKAPAIDPANNIVQLATADEIKAALNISSSPRGINCFSIRGTELLTFNFVDSNTVYKVDLDTFDYGDLDGDFDADLADFAALQRCFMQDVSTSGCGISDFDDDSDVDLDDYEAFQAFFVGPR